MADPHETRGIKLGTIKGAAIIIQPSTLVMILVLAVIYSGSGAGQLSSNAFSMGVLMAVLLFVSVFIHELAHAIAAWSFGRKVSTIVLTLWGGHTTFDARNITPGVVATTAIAGPAANALLAVGAWAAAASGALSGTVLSVVEWLVWANILLAVFNALPGIPMDGGRVLSGIVWAATGDRLKATRIAGWAGRVIAIAVAILMIGYPILFGRGVDIINVAFAALLFSVIWPAASAAIKAVDTQAKRESATVAAIMRPAVGIPYTATVLDARALALGAGVMDVVILSADGSPAAIASLPTMDRVPEQQREHEGLQSVSVPIPRGATVEPGLEGEELITVLREWYGRADSWAVVDGGVVVGVVRIEEVVAALQ